MIVRVFRYSFAQAKARSMRGKLLSPDDWHYLLRMKGLEDILKYLSGTDYSLVLSRFSGARLEAGAISLALHDDLFAAYAKLLKAVPSKSSHIPRSFLSLYEAENLKTILRGLFQGKAAAYIRSLLYRLGPLSLLPVEDLLEARQVAEAIELLKPSPFHRPLLHALPQFHAQGRLFPLERAIDIAVMENIHESLKFVSGLDRKGVEILTGEWIDLANLSWIVRLRRLYGLSPEETINYTVPGGRYLGLRELGAVARAPDRPSFLSALPHPYDEALGRTEDWEQIQTLLSKWFVGELQKTFSQDPFQIRLALSYLLLKELEVKSLGSLITAVELGEPTGNLVDLISLPVKGGAHV